MNRGKKKTAIVSCYFIHSYGSMLQAYATQKVLDKVGIENETINVYGFLKGIRKNQYMYILKSGLTSELFRSRIKRGINQVKKKFIRDVYAKNIALRDAKYDEFYDKFIRLSKVHTSLEELKDDCYQEYENVLLGSDQLWLPQNIVANYYTLNFVPEGINTVTFATSFGVASLPEDIEMMTQSFLKKIKHISVREDAGKEIIKKLATGEVDIIIGTHKILQKDVVFKDLGLLIIDEEQRFGVKHKEQIKELK